MHFIEDSRQKLDKHALKHDAWALMGDKVLRCKLAFGDYALPPKVAVDTKEDMSEIAQNIGNEHVRFREECKLAKEYGCHLYFLIENREGVSSLEDVRRWYNPRLDVSPGAIDGPRLEKAMRTMQERYGCTFLFCQPEEAAQRVKDLLEGGV